MKKLLSAIIVVVFSVGIFAQLNIQYNSTDEVFANPERGFYTHTSAWNESGALTANQLNNARKKNHSLILRLYYIPKFIGSDLNTAFFNLLDSDFKLMRQTGVKCLLRFAYSNNIGVADAPLNIVLRHLDQLQPYLEEYSDVIAFMQAGFIGAWGEWHSSTNNLENTTSRRAIVEKMLSVLPKDRMIQLRTPAFKTAIFSNSTPISESEAFDESNYSRTGHHNDCFLADDTDMGTYSDTTGQKTYISLDGRYVPVGGETCSPSDFSLCPNSVYQMERLHWTYVNSSYHQTVIGGWNTNGCYTEIENRLGYRFELVEGTFSDSTKPGGALTASVKIYNSGFASLYNPRNVELILRNETDTFFVKLPEDARFWQAGDTVALDFTTGIPASIENGNYELLLNLPDPSENLHDSPTFSIRTANEDTWEAATGYNNLNASININPDNEAESYTGELIFQKKSGTVSVPGTTLVQDYEIYIRNYPNPFNSNTVLDYSLTEPGNVNIKIYNALGEEVYTLLNEYKNAGKYQLRFNSEIAAHLTSGIYYYVMSTQDKMVSGKMVLMK